LSQAEAKGITAGIQQVLTDVQVAEWQADQRACPGCRNQRSLKGHHPIVFRTPFGTLRLASERARLCPSTPVSNSLGEPIGGAAERARQFGDAVSWA
jgi:hypothetical protein